MSNRAMRVLRASVRRLAAVGIGTVVAGAAVLVGAVPAAAAVTAPSTTVDCSTMSLQTAIDNAAPGATLIVTGTCLGNFTISKDLTLLGRGAAVLDGQHAGGTLTVSSSTVNVTNLTITNGSNFSLGTAGGGISNGGTLTLLDSVVSGNAGFVGGIFNQGSLTLEATTVSGNSGAVAGGGIDNLGAATLGASTVSGNTTSGFAGFGGLGGGIFSAGPLTLNDTKVSGNHAVSGGGIDNNAGGNATVNNSIVSDNTANRGAGIDDDEGALTLNDSAVRHNTASTNGGGISLEVFDVFGSVQLRDSTVTSNAPDNCFPTGSIAGCSG